MVYLVNVNTKNYRFGTLVTPPALPHTQLVESRTLLKKGRS